MILHYGKKKTILKFDNYWLSELHNGSGTKNRFHQLWMYKIFKHHKLPCIPWLGEMHVKLQWYNISPLLFLLLQHKFFPLRLWLRHQTSATKLRVLQGTPYKSVDLFSISECQDTRTKVKLHYWIISGCRSALNLKLSSYKPKPELSPWNLQHLVWNEILKLKV